MDVTKNGTKDEQNHNEKVMESKLLFMVSPTVVNRSPPQSNIQPIWDLNPGPSAFKRTVLWSLPLRQSD